MSQQINLFNPIFLKQKTLFSALTMVQALALILLGSVCLSAYTVYELANLGKEAAIITGQLQSAQSQLARINAEYGRKEKSKVLEEEAQRMEADITSLRRVIDTVQSGDFGNTQGYSAYMQAFSRQIVPGLWLTGFAIQGAGNEIQLQGRALRPELVPAYISKLKREPIMRGRSFATLDMHLTKADAMPKEGEGDQATSVRRVSSDYIEFSLQSSGIAVPQLTSPGVPGK